MKQGIIFILLLGLGFSQTDVTSKLVSYDLNIDANSQQIYLISDVIGLINKV